MRSTATGRPMTRRREVAQGLAVGLGPVLLYALTLVVGATVGAVPGVLRAVTIVLFDAALVASLVCLVGGRSRSVGLGLLGAVVAICLVAVGLLLTVGPAPWDGEPIQGGDIPVTTNMGALEARPVERPGLLCSALNNAATYTCAGDARDDALWAASPLHNVSASAFGAPLSWVSKNAIA